MARMMCRLWQGIIIFMELGTAKEIDPEILDELKARTTFRGLNPMANTSVLVALQRRYKVMNNSDK